MCCCLEHDWILEMDDLERVLRCNMFVSVSACVPHCVFPQGDPNSPSAGAPSCSLKMSAAQLVRIVLHCISTTMTWHAAFFCTCLHSLVFSPPLSLSLSFFFSFTISPNCAFFSSLSLAHFFSRSLEILSLLWELTWIALPPGLPQAPFIMML